MPSAAIPEPGHLDRRPVPNLGDADTRARLTRAAVQGLARLADVWKLNAGEIALLAGFSERSWARAKAGSWPGTLSQDQMTRASTLIGIFKGLKLLFSDPLANEWVRLPNRNRLFGGRPPIEAMIAGGIPVLLEVRRHIDALRGGL